MRWLLLVPLLSGCVLYDPDPDPTDPEQGDTRIVAAGWTNGNCWGLCNGDLAITGADVALTLRPVNTDPPDQVRRGVLTAAAVDELAAIGRGLAGVTLAETYGCPGCDDGPASHVDVVRGDIVTRTTYEGGAPPTALTAADAFLADVMDALASCAPSTRVTTDACATP